MTSKLKFHEDNTTLTGSRKNENKEDNSSLVQWLIKFKIFSSIGNARVFLFFIIFLTMVITSVMVFKITPKEAINSPLAAPTI